MTICDSMKIAVEKRLDEKRSIEQIGSELCSGIKFPRKKVIHIIKEIKGKEFLEKNADWLCYEAKKVEGGKTASVERVRKKFYATIDMQSMNQHASTDRPLDETTQQSKQIETPEQCIIASSPSISTPATEQSEPKPEPTVSTDVATIPQSQLLEAKPETVIETHIQPTQGITAPTQTISPVSTQVPSMEVTESKPVEVQAEIKPIEPTPVAPTPQETIPEPKPVEVQAPQEVKPEPKPIEAAKPKNLLEILEICPSCGFGYDVNAKRWYTAGEIKESLQGKKPPLDLKREAMEILAKIDIDKNKITPETIKFLRGGLIRRLGEIDKDSVYPPSEIEHIVEEMLASKIAP